MPHAIHPRLRDTLLIAAVVVLIGTAAFSAWRANAQISSAIRVRGNQLLDPVGKPITLIGAARSGLEYSCTGVGPYDVDTFAAMRSWNIDTVRLAVSSAFWFDNVGCPEYRQVIDTAVANAEDAGLYVIIDLHGGTGHPEMADEESQRFWTSILGVYRSNRYLMAELFNEPHDVSWTVWHNGGEAQVAEGSFTAVGMQHLIDGANAAAPDIPLIVNGLGWSYDFSGIARGYAVYGRNLIYGVHIYNYEGKQPQDWANDFGFLAAHYPGLITEFGDSDHCDGSWLRLVLPQMLRVGIGIIAWSWIVTKDYCHYPALVSDWQGAPSPYGQPVHDFFLAS